MDSSSPPPEKGPRLLRTLVDVGVVAAIIVGGLVGAVLVSQTTQQPIIAILEVDFSRSLCLRRVYQDYAVTFTLSNIGNAPGFANVQFYIDGTPRAEKSYFLHTGERIQRILEAFVGDCNNHALDLSISGVWK